MRLIDADDFIAKTRELYNQAGWGFRDIHYSQSDVEMNLSMMPTIDPVRHGRWLWDDKHRSYYCTECLFYAFGDNIDILNGRFQYCPSCAAKMRGFDNEDYG